MMIMFLVLLLVLGGPLVYVLNLDYQQGRDLRTTQEQLDEQQDAFVSYQVKQVVKSCKGSNNSRRAIQKVLDGAATPTGVAAVDFSTVDGYNSLTPETQFFLNNLQVLTNRPGGTNLKQLADDYRQTNPSNQNCDQLGHDLKEKLDANS